MVMDKIVATNLFNLIGYMKNIILSAILTVVAKWLLPVRVAMAIDLAEAIKEALKESRKR